MALLVRGIVGFLRLFALDKRSLALFRVAMAIVTLYDINNRFPDIHNHYSDNGMLSRATVLSKFQNSYWLCVHMIAGTDFYVQLIFLLHAAIAICMMVGFRTKLFTFLNWVMVCSLQNRNYLVCHSGDTVQRVMMFWAIFLPIGDLFSLDSILWPKTKPSDKSGGGNNNRNTEVLGVAAICFTIQIYIMYFTAHFHKSAPEWRELGVATYMALQLDFFRTWIGDIFMLFPWLCKQLTFAVLYWQVTGVLIYFLPAGRFNKYLKGFSIFGFMFMHASFGMCLNLEQFTWVTEASLAGAIPGWVWDELLKYLTRNQKRTMYIFYIARHQYRAIFAQILGLFMLPKTKMVPTDVLPGATNGGFFGLSVIDSNKVQHNGADALEVITKSSPLLYPLHYAFNTNVVKSAVNCVPTMCYEGQDLEFGNIKHSKEFDYENEANQDQNIKITYVDEAAEHSKKHVFVQENPNMYALRKAIPFGLSVMQSMMLSLFLYLVISWNAGNIGYYSLATPNSLRPLIWVTQLDQYWGMFAPRPPDVMWWYNIEGALDDGTSVELFNNGALFTLQPNIPHTYDKPRSLHESMGNHRWFKIFENGINSHEEREDLKLNFGRWLCREYNARHFDTKRLYSFSIHWMNERVDIVKQDGTRYPGQKFTLWNHICYDK